MKVNKNVKELMKFVGSPPIVVLFLGMLFFVVAALIQGSAHTTELTDCYDKKGNVMLGVQCEEKVSEDYSFLGNNAVNSLVSIGTVLMFAGIIFSVLYAFGVVSDW